MHAVAPPALVEEVVHEIGPRRHGGNGGVVGGGGGQVGPDGLRGPQLGPVGTERFRPVTLVQVGGHPPGVDPLHPGDHRPPRLLRHLQIVLVDEGPVDLLRLGGGPLQGTHGDVRAGLGPVVKGIAAHTKALLNVGVVHEAAPRQLVSVGEERIGHIEAVPRCAGEVHRHRVPVLPGGGEGGEVQGFIAPQVPQRLVGGVVQGLPCRAGIGPGGDAPQIEPPGHIGLHPEHGAAGEGHGPRPGQVHPAGGPAQPGSAPQEVGQGGGELPGPQGQLDLLRPCGVDVALPGQG